MLYGNLAPNGSIIKTAAVPSKLLTFTGRARVFESQDSAVEAILNDQVQKGDAVIIRYEGPSGGPGMQEMLYPTSYLKSKGLDQDCALITDGRFSGGTSGLSIGHVSPEAASAGTIGLVQDGDTIHIDIPNRQLELQVEQPELDSRRQLQSSKGWQPVSRNRRLSTALRVYAKHALSADQGAARVV